MTKHQRPQRVYDFTAASMRMAPIPGDRLDAALASHADAIVEVQIALEELDKPLTADRLDPKFVRAIVSEAREALQQLATDSARAAGRAASAAQQAANAASAAEIATSPVLARAEALLAVERDALRQLELQQQLLFELDRKVEDLAQRPALREPTLPVGVLGPNAGGFYAGDEKGATATAADYAEVSSTWAEWMGPGGLYGGSSHTAASDVIPANILAINAITGDHWSSRWWANRAAAAVGGQLAYLYLGPYPSPPLTTPNGGPIPLGAIYWNTANGSMYVWNGTSWAPFNSPTKAATSSLFYNAAANQTVFNLGTADLFGSSHTLDPQGSEGTEVYFNGVRLTPTLDYAVNAAANTITLVNPAPAGSVVGVDVLTPPSQLAFGQVTINKLRPIVADGVTTTFPLIDAGGAPVRVADAAQLLIILDGVSQEPGVDFIIDANFTSIIFAQAPTADAKSFIVMLGNAFTLSGALVHDVSLIGDGTVTSPLGVAFSVLDTRYLLLSGGTMGGAIDLGGFTATGGGPPALPSDLTNKTYVDTLVASRAVFQGVYVIGTNAPDLTNTAGNSAGYWWLAATVDPSFPDPLIIDLPGLPAGTLLNNGDNIIWNAALGVYQTLAGSSLTRVEADTLYLPFTGGVLTGPLILNADPVANLGAATKDYVDSRVGGAGYLPLAGGAMTGFLILVANPINPLDAATKQYVDTAQAAGGASIFMNRGFDAAGHNSTLPGTYYTQGGPSGAPPVGPGRFLYNSFTVTDANPPNGPITVQESFFFNAGFTQIVSRWVRSLDQGVWSPWLQVALTAPDLTPYALTTYVNAQDALKLNLAGGAMTGGLVLNADPTAPLDAATKQYVDAQVVTGAFLPLTGGAMTGNLNFPVVGQGLTLAGGSAFYSTTSGNLGLNTGTLTVNGATIVNADITSTVQMHIVRGNVGSNVWNQQQFVIQHSGVGASTPVSGSAGIAFYNYNTPANGDLRKTIMQLARTPIGGQNQFRFMDGDNSQLCRIAASSYDVSFAAQSPMAQYVENEVGEFSAQAVEERGGREVDLVKVIEGLLRRVGDLEVELRTLRRLQ